VSHLCASCSAGGAGGAGSDAKGPETTTRQKDAQAPTFVGRWNSVISQSFLPAACSPAGELSNLFVYFEEGGGVF